MATLCKKAFLQENGSFYGSIFISVIIHLFALLQVAKSPILFEEKLLGKKGGPEEATEISFFPTSFVPQGKLVRSSSPALEVPTRDTAATATKPRSESEKLESGGTLTKGIGAGGSSTQYHAVLHAYLDSAKAFPSALKDLGLSGTVRVRFQVTPEGFLEDIRLVESQAPRPLQAEALKFLQKLKRVPIPPSEASPEELQFELPLRYELNS